MGEGGKMEAHGRNGEGDTCMGMGKKLRSREE